MAIALSLQRQALLVRKAADDNHDEIDQGPDTKSAKGQDHQDAGADLADIKSVNTNGAQKKAEQNGRDKSPGAILNFGGYFAQGSGDGTLGPKNLTVVPGLAGTRCFLLADGAFLSHGDF